MASSASIYQSRTVTDVLLKSLVKEFGALTDLDVQVEAALQKIWPVSDSRPGIKDFCLQCETVNESKCLCKDSRIKKSFLFLRSCWRIISYLKGEIKDKLWVSDRNWREEVTQRGCGWRLSEALWWKQSQILKLCQPDRPHWPIGSYTSSKAGPQHAKFYLLYQFY